MAAAGTGRLLRAASRDERWQALLEASKRADEAMIPGSCGAASLNLRFAPVVRSMSLRALP